MANKKTKYVPSRWSHIKPKEDDRRKLTLFVAGAVPTYLPERLDRLTSNYDVVTVMCAGNTGRYGLPEGKEKTEMEKTVESWAKQRKQHYDIIPYGNLEKLNSWMKFMGPDGNKAVVVYDDGSSHGEDVKFAEALSKEENVQFKKVTIPKDQTISNAADFKSENYNDRLDDAEFTKAVAGIKTSDSQLSK